MGIKQMDFEKLLEPYKEGGTINTPIERTIGTMASKLIIVYRLPVEIVGAAMFRVFYAMAYEGLKFKGNEKYGSKGAELFSCIKAQAIDITQKDAAKAVLKEINDMTSCVDQKCKKRMKIRVPRTKWWTKVKKV